MVQNPKYNPSTDVQAVEQFGFIDLNDAFLNHNIPAAIDDQDISYNEIEDPASILGKPSDVFEAYRMIDGINNATPKGESTE